MEERSFLDKKIISSSFLTTFAPLLSCFALLFSKSNDNKSCDFCISVQNFENEYGRLAEPQRVLYSSKIV